MSDMDWNSQVIEEFRTNGGTVGGPLAGMPILLLHHTGARTGQERVNPLAYQRVGDALAIFASKGGAPTNPDWYHNLRANPSATIEVGQETYPVVARVTEPDERDQIWEQQKRDFPNFAEYEQMSGGRRIPVVVLERA
jgi:deazaflavin-dependent oxidoreductase (nitroreductase family)